MFKKILSVIIFLFGLGLAICVDLSFGLITVILGTSLFQEKITFFLINWGMFFSILPDLDFIKQWLKKEKASGGHKKDSRLHSPIAVITPLIIIMCFLLFCRLKPQIMSYTSLVLAALYTICHLTYCIWKWITTRCLKKNLIKFGIGILIIIAMFIGSVISIFLSINEILMFGFIAISSLLWHFFHDLTEEGPGIDLWPFCKGKRFLFRINKERPIISFSLNEEDLNIFYKQTVGNWLENDYLCWKFKPISGVIILIITIIVTTFVYLNQ